jgi:hypothetical protein
MKIKCDQCKEEFPSKFVELSDRTGVFRCRRCLFGEEPPKDDAVKDETN